MVALIPIDPLPAMSNLEFRRFHSSSTQAPLASVRVKSSGSIWKFIFYKEAKCVCCTLHWQFQISLVQTKKKKVLSCLYLCNKLYLPNVNNSAASLFLLPSLTVQWLKNVFKKLLTHLVGFVMKKKRFWLIW